MLLLWQQQHATLAGKVGQISHIYMQLDWGNGIEVHPGLSAKGGGKGAVRSMRYLQFIAAMGIQMGEGGEQMELVRGQICTYRPHRSWSAFGFMA